MTKKDERKIRVALLYGGRSGEHEVSLQSAASILQNLDSKRFEVIPIGITPEGRWLFNDLNLIEKNAKSLSILKQAPEVIIPPRPNLSSGGGTELLSLSSKGAESGALSKALIDVVFPVLHGTFGEDGTIQGFFELANIPYVGPGVLSSAVGMDKDVAKRLVAASGVSVAPYLVLRSSEWPVVEGALKEKIKMGLGGFPVFIKPANQGSSVGIHKVKDEKSLRAAVEDAFLYDTKILVEKAIDAREIELAVLENDNPNLPPIVSVVGEIVPKHEFYSYEAKYLDENGAALVLPAEISKAQATSVQKMAADVFWALECEGMARVDFFLDRKSGEFYFNEINTIPGFTKISMYPKLMEASGVSYQELLSKLIDLAIARHKRRDSLKRKKS